MNSHRYRIFKEHNLILAQIINVDEPIHKSIKTLTDMLAEDENYAHGMDFIADMKKPTYPENEIYYNDMARNLSIRVRFNKFIRIICPKDETLKRNYKVFLTFASDESDVAAENHFVRNINEALCKLRKDSDRDLLREVEDFYIYYTKRR